MQLISNGSQGPSTIPAKRPASGTPGFANNTPGTQTPTVWDADVANTIIAEIANVILAAGIALDPTNNAQLLAAIRGLSPSSLTSNGWKKYPDPNSPTGFFIDQWGFGSSSTWAGINGGDIPFSIPFPNACLSVQIMEGSAGTWNAGSATVYASNAQTTTGFAVQALIWNGSQFVGPGTDTLGFRWMAKGY